MRTRFFVPNVVQVASPHDFSALTGANPHTDEVSIFTLTGTVNLKEIWGVVTTALGNHTAAYWRLNDGAAQSNITLNTGTTLSSFAAGSVLAKTLVATSALSGLSNATTTSVAGSAATPHDQILVAKAATATTVRYLFTTTDLTDVGAITFYALYVPLSADGALVAV